MAYRNWGFWDNPFGTDPLPPTEHGSKLLVGRDEVLRNIKRRLDNSSKIVTVEGLNGVGKTSVVNVMAYRAFSETLRTGIGPLYVPCRKPFQLSVDVDADEFRLSVLREVAQTLIECHAEIPPPPGRTRTTNNTALDRFLNSPQVKSFSGSLLQFGLGYSSETNTGSGFEKSGFEKAVLDWLEQIFPTSTSGGVVCIIDNLELLQTCQNARDALERLRDSLFSVRGVRWVLCGALGIVHGVASSPRLDGKLHKPVVVEDLDEKFAGEIFDNRIRAFRDSRSSKLPLSRSQFIEIYDIMRGNLRSVLSECDDFCMWVSDRVEERDEFEDDFFEAWLAEELETAFYSVRSELRPRALEVFETACQFEVFSPSDCEVFGYETPNAMRQQIRNLEAVGLLKSAVDESDKRRKSIQVTSKGWKVRAYLDFFEDSF
ncbi:P-loop NTPase family protein [Rhodovulum strictum]|uniref:Orc1-like AAA ATPase domain-containing protein n=1 Tax=Rhodovulum strictum TaxID=58314 RepID=A0A844B9K7_9RHOB|nr:ATP-binding protein [Rhodovulum strictum]MRH19369.1 hypothetical protein [Rhodovulum strictum]